MPKQLARFVLLASLVGCTQRFPEPDPTAQKSSYLETLGDAEGYVHNYASSKFRLGQVSSFTTGDFLVRTIGDQGVFAYDPRLGVSTAILHGSTAATPPLTTDGETHNARVRKYFVDAGLPEAQIRTVSAQPRLEGGGRTADGPPVLSLTKFTSVISRQVEGTPVADSVAFASFDVQDETTSEFVHWPRIPSAVIAEAKAMSSLVSDPDGLAGFRAKAGISADATGRVVVHHTRHTERASTHRFWVTYDVIAGRTELHFQLDGSDTSLGAEPTGTPDQPSK